MNGENSIVSPESAQKVDRRIPMRLCAIALLAAVGVSAAVAGCDQPGRGSIQSSEGRRIVDAVIGEAGICTVVTEDHGISGIRLEILKCNTRGQKIDVSLVDLPELSSQVKCYPWRGGVAIGWLDGEGRLWFVTATGVVSEPRRVLADKPERAVGYISDWWLCQENGGTCLILLRYEDGRSAIDERTSGKPGADSFEAFSRLHTSSPVLYKYNCGDSGLEPSGSYTIDSKPFASGRILCAGGATECRVWQIINTAGRDLSTVRAAIVRDSGALEWHEVYTGNNPLGLCVDGSSGAVAMVSEWKNPADSAGIVSLIYAESGRIQPVSATASVRSRCRFRAVSSVGGNICMVARQDPGKAIEVVRVRGHLREDGTMTVDARGVVDFAITSVDEDAYLVLLRKDSLELVRVVK